MLRSFRITWLLAIVGSLVVLVAAPVPAGAETLGPAPEGTFTFAVIPDTQRYLGPGSGREDESEEPSNPAFDSRTTWLADNLEAQRVVFVTHTGDIVDRLNDFQWQIARENMDRVHGKVPYGIVVGNHDMERESGDSSMFQKYFGAERYEGEPWYAGTYAGLPDLAPAVSGNNANSYQLFSAEGLDFVIVHVECNAPDDVLAWVDDVLETHRDRMAIIATHMYLGGIPRKGIDVPQGRMEWKKVHGERGNTPQQLWDKCFRNHPNVFLIVCGDQSISITHHQTSLGKNLNPVHEVLTDYPRDRDESDWVRLFRFVPVEHKIQVWTYSPAQDALCEQAGHIAGRRYHQFDLDIAKAIAFHRAQNEVATSGGTP